MHQEISNPTHYHAALYIRLSKEDEREGPSESVNNQNSLLTEFVRRHHLCVYDTYIDDGWSGTNFQRPNFQRMLADIEAGRVNMVITKDLSRLGRDYILTGHYMERYFPEHQVRYISLLDGIDTGVDSTANDITPFRAIMNDMYAKDISKKITSVKRDKQRRGLFIGGKPVYGYRMHPTEKNRIVIDEAAASTVRHIFGMALDGVSCRQIAARLNEEGVPTPAAYAGLAVRRPGPYTGRWSSERISEMLQNETYTGSMVQGRTRKVSYKSKKSIRLDRRDWIVVAGTHQPIIDREAFDTVQALLGSRRRTRSRTYDFLLKGLIFCRECGHPLAVINRKTASGEDRLFFICRTYQRFTQAGACTSHTMKEQSVTQAVLEKVHEVCRPFLRPDQLLPIAEREVAQALAEAGLKQDSNVLNAEIDRLSAQLDRVYLDHLQGGLDNADFQRVFTKLKADRAALQQCLDRRENLDPTPAEQADLAKQLVERFLDSAFTNRALLVSLMERIELTADKQIIIQFRFRQPEANF